jgi:hypothetical protein
MKIKGEIVKSREVVEVVIPRTNGESLKFKVGGYPLGINRAYDAICPKPLAPFKTINKVGGVVDRVYDYYDSAYGIALDEWQYYFKYFIVYQGMKEDNDVSFDSKCDSLDGIKAFEAELAAAGFSEGDVGIIFDAIKGASNIDPKRVEAAKANF